LGSNIYGKKSFCYSRFLSKKVFCTGHGLHKFVLKLDSLVPDFLFGDVLTEASWLRRGPPKGSKHCDFQETLKFLHMFRKRARNVYQIYHSKLHFDIKKVYRYLRYCVKANLIEIDHIEGEGPFHAKYYRLTDKGRTLVELFSNSRKNMLLNE